MNTDLQKMKQPFLSMIYTISSHQPFDVPSYKKISGTSSSEKYCNSVSYADSCLGSFIDHLKNSPLWENSLVIITSDHATLDPGPTTIEDPASYRIPLLWIGGVIDTSFVVNNIAMQTDLSSTLIQQMGWKSNPSFFSKNIFGSKQYTFYYRDEGWGFLSPEMGFFMNLESKKQKYFYGEQSPERDSLTKFSKSYTQFLHDDFLRK
jgi:phosphoglycerol transferase MdoB-like AlkP superfamily enzyme